MSVYALVGVSLQQIGGDRPDGWIVMSSPRPEGEDSTDYTARPDGSWEISEETLRARASSVEVAWQSGEISAIADQLLALEEEAKDALPGTRKQWLTYRTSVRLWHESPDFPNATKRPTRPT